MAGIHLNSTVWTGSRLPNCIADVVLSYFWKFYLYIYSICGAWSQAILLSQTIPQDVVSFVLIGNLKPRRRWCLGWDVSSNCSYIPRRWMQMSMHLWLRSASWSYFSAILLHKSRISEKMRCVEVPHSVTPYENGEETHGSQSERE